MGNSLGRTSSRRSEMEATTGWTEGKPWEIAWGELRSEGARWKRRQDGRRGNCGNSLGRAPLGKSEMEATTRWTEGKPWEINTFNYFTGKVLRTEAFTQRSLDFRQSSLDTEKLALRSLLHRAAFSHRSFSTACTRRGFDTEKSLHIRVGAFTQRSSYTQRSFYTQTLLHKETFIHRAAFTHRNVYTQRSFTHGSF